MKNRLRGIIALAMVVAATVAGALVTAAPAQATGIPNPGSTKQGVTMGWEKSGDTKSPMFTNRTGRSVRVDIYVNDHGKWNAYGEHTDGWEPLGPGRLRPGQSAIVTSWHVGMKLGAPLSVLRFRVHR